MVSTARCAIELRSSTSSWLPRPPTFKISASSSVYVFVSCMVGGLMA